MGWRTTRLCVQRRGCELVLLYCVIVLLACSAAVPSMSRERCIAELQMKPPCCLVVVVVGEDADSGCWCAALQAPHYSPSAFFAGGLGMRQPPLVAHRRSWSHRKSLNLRRTLKFFSRKLGSSVCTTGAGNISSWVGRMWQDRYETAIVPELSQGMWCTWRFQTLQALDLSLSHSFVIVTNLA